MFDPNPDFKSAFALPGGYITVGGGLLAITQTEDELANVLAHEIEDMELGQVGRGVKELARQKEIRSLEAILVFLLKCSTAIGMFVLIEMPT